MKPRIIIHAGATPSGDYLSAIQLASLYALPLYQCVIYREGDIMHENDIHLYPVDDNSYTKIGNKVRKYLHP